MTYQQVIVFLFIPEDVLLLIASLQLFCPFLIFSEAFAAVITQQMCYGLLRSQIPALGLIFSTLFLSCPPLRFVLPLSVYIMSDKILATSNLFVHTKRENMVQHIKITANQNDVDEYQTSRKCCVTYSGYGWLK